MPSGTLQGPSAHPRLAARLPRASGAPMGRLGLGRETPRRPHAASRPRQRPPHPASPSASLPAALGSSPALTPPLLTGRSCPLRLRNRLRSSHMPHLPPAPGPASLTRHPKHGQRPRASPREPFSAFSTRQPERLPTFVTSHAPCAGFPLPFKL